MGSFRKFINKIYSFVDNIVPIWRVIFSALLTAIIMMSLILIVYFTSVPNPNMILIAGLVACSAIFGWAASITSSLLMILYSMFFFSTNKSFIYFTQTNGQKLIVIVIGVIVCALFVSLFRRNIQSERQHLLARNEKLTNVAHLDTLTATKNRYAFKSDMKLANNKELILMVVDVDNFKEINDKHGHQNGDKALIYFSQELKNLFGDEHVYRFGGDEFIIVDNETSAKEFKNLLEDLKQNLNQIKEFDIRFSAGFVRGKIDENLTLEDLIEKADNELYNAKSNGKDCYKFKDLLK